MKKRYLVLGAVLAGIVALCAFAFPWTVATYTTTSTPATFDGGSLSADARCRDGDEVTGGGFQLNWVPQGSDAAPLVLTSNPLVNRSGQRFWHVDGYSANAQPNSALSAYAVCVHQG